MRIGIIGAGQLGQMLGFAARELDVECRFLDPAESPPAASTGPVIRKPFDDADALSELAADCDVVSYEFENVPVDALVDIADRVPVYPPPAALRHAQDRLAEKELFGELGIPLPKYRRIDSLDDLEDAVRAIGLPLVIKTRRFGYDGKGQAVIGETSDIGAAWERLGGRPLVAEQHVRFECEVSAIGVRSVSGDTAFYPLTRNEHEGGILRRSFAPCGNESLEAEAHGYLQRLLEHLDYVGVLALELFVVDGRLYANEFAPRVHNSGHWTIEGAETSQFANHVRAVCGRPPGPTAARGHAGMFNLVGSIPSEARELPDDGCWLHDYGKEPRPGRKLGHITVLAASARARDRRLNEIRRILDGM